MKQWLTFFISIFVTTYSVAQMKTVVRVKGQVCDSATREYVDGASVVCLLSRDSSGIGWTYTNRIGFFEIDSVPIGSYYLRITCIGFRTVYRFINLSDGEKVMDLGLVSMVHVGVELPVFSVVKKKQPIRIVKDTIEFSAGNYRLPEHSNLEELIKRLPGVQVDENGSIRVNGQLITLLLVDGKPFFSNDYRIASKNLKAEIIEKVQLLDRIVKERNPSSFDVNAKEKVINITLKKSSKNTWAKEFVGGVGNGKHFSTKVNFSRFRDNEQNAFFLNYNNINDLIDGGGGGVGSNRKLASNFNLTKNINDKVTITSNYSMSNVGNVESQISACQTFVADTSYYYDKDYNKKSTTTTNVMNSRLDLKLNPRMAIIFENNISYTADETGLVDRYMSYGYHRQKLDSSLSERSVSSSFFDVYNKLNIDRKFEKIGYALNFDISYGTSSKREKSYNFTNSSLIRDDGGYISDSINQYVRLSNRTNYLQLMITQSLPISKKSILSLSYAFSTNNNPYEKFVYDFNQATKHFDRLNDTLTGSFRYSSRNSFARLGIESKTEKLDYSMSLYAMFFNIFATTYNNELESKAFVLIPRGSISYRFQDNKKVSVFLMGNPIVPGGDQLLPIPDNSNPLLVRIGNENLKTGNMYGLALEYASFNSDKTTFFTLSVNGSFKRNEIVNGIWVDSLRRQVLRSLNVSGAYDTKINSTYSFPVFKSKSIVNTNSSLIFGKALSYMNNLRTQNTYLTLSQLFSYNYTYRSILNMSAGAGYSYTTASYDMPSLSTARYLSFRFSLSSGFRFPFDLTVGSDVSYSLTAGREEEFNSNALLMNVFISQEILHGNRGLIKLQAFDLMNRNVSINRTVGPTYIEDSRVNVLQRLFMLSFTLYLK